MSTLRNQLVEGFVKGLGKASAAILVMGVIGGAWYMANKVYKPRKVEMELEEFQDTRQDFDSDKVKQILAKV